MLRRLLVAAAVVSCLLVPAAPALASGDTVIKDCVQNGRLTKKYSQQEYRSALANLPTDVDEYTDCRDIIRNAQLGGGGGGGGTSGGGGAGGNDPYTGATPDEVNAAKQDIAHARLGPGVAHIGTQVVTPGALAYHDVGAVSKLPAPLLVLALMITVAALAVGTYLLVSRVRTGRNSA